MRGSRGVGTSGAKEKRESQPPGKGRGERQQGMRPAAGFNRLETSTGASVISQIVRSVIFCSLVRPAHTTRPPPVFPSRFLARFSTASPPVCPATFREPTRWKMVLLFHGKRSRIVNREWGIVGTGGLEIASRTIVAARLHVCACSCAEWVFDITSSR